MKLRIPILAMTISQFAIASLCYSQSNAKPDETKMTVAGAIATDNHWSQAEVHGDTAYLAQLLLPEYRSVDLNGVAHSRAVIIKGAKRNIGTDAGVRAAAAYHRAHPYATSTVLVGNTIVLSFYNPSKGPQNGVMSSDILVYVGGRWHSLYSQHAKSE